MFYNAESKRLECLKLKIMIGGEEISALLETRCEISILNEQLHNKLCLLELNCLEPPTQHLNIVSAERGKRRRKQALLEIQIGDKVDQHVLLSSQLLTDAILVLYFLINHAAELSFPDRKVALKINETFCKLEFQSVSDATRQTVAETSFKKQARNRALNVDSSVYHITHIRRFGYRSTTSFGAFCSYDRRQVRRG